MNKWCDGGPVIIDSWFGRIDETTVNRAVVDLTSHLMACWSKTLNMLLNAQGLLEAGALYQLRHGHLQMPVTRSSRSLLKWSMNASMVTSRPEALPAPNSTWFSNRGASCK